jgi:hypothetical protein
MLVIVQGKLHAQRKIKHINFTLGKGKEVSEVLHFWNCIAWLRGLDIMKFGAEIFGAEIFGEHRNGVLQTEASLMY